MKGNKKFSHIILYYLNPEIINSNIILFNLDAIICNLNIILNIK